MLKDLTWEKARKFYLALAGAAAALVANWADAPSWVVAVVGALTAGAVWLAPNGPSASGG